MFDQHERNPEEEQGAQWLVVGGWAQDICPVFPSVGAFQSHPEPSQQGVGWEDPKSTLGVWCLVVTGTSQGTTDLQLCF